MAKTIEHNTVGADHKAIWKYTKTDDGIMTGIIPLGYKRRIMVTHLCPDCTHTNQDECSWFSWPPVMPKGAEYVVRMVKGKYPDLFIIHKCPNYDGD